MTTSLAKVYCPYCGNRSEKRFAEGLERAFCPACERILYENPVPATCIVVWRQNRLLLVKRKFPPCENQWCLPGGFMEIQEQPTDAALRELEEETGLKGRITRFLGAIAMPGSIYSGLLILGYAAVVNETVPVPGDDASAVEWFAVAERPPIAFDSHVEFIRRVREGDFITDGII